MKPGSKGNLDKDNQASSIQLDVQQAGNNNNNNQQQQ